MVLGLLVHVTPSNFFRRIFMSEALVYKSYFFQNSRSAEIILFDIRFSYKHCNFSRVCLLVKMASKTSLPPSLFFRPYPQFSLWHKWQLFEITARLKLVSVSLSSIYFVVGDLEESFRVSIMQSFDMRQSHSR